MLLVIGLLSLLYLKFKGGYAVSFEEKQQQNLMVCITTIVEKYFSDEKTLTYVDMNPGDYEILKEIHLSTVTTMVFRQATAQFYFGHQGYLINANNATKFTEYFKHLLEDPTWNPSSRFIIVIRSLHEDELKKIFDELLKRHVVNVVVVSGTDDVHLYTYNPFDNYACGKYYNNVISYGLCSNTTRNLFPNKYVTGLRNCTFHATIPHRPPCSIHPHLAEDKRMTLGAEQYLFKVLGELEHFKVNFSFDHISEKYSTIAPNMKVTGPMAMLQNNETDVMFGNTMLVSSRADAFTYLHGYLDYYDEVRYFVRKASHVPMWKNAYLEFCPLVWFLLFFVYLIYSIIMSILLHIEDKISLMLKLLKYFLSTGCSLPHQMNTNVRCIFIIWVWCASLINCYYQSSLVSLMSKPIKEYQVSNEADIARYDLKACMALSMLEYIKSETNLSTAMDQDCLDTMKSLKKVAQSEDLFALVPYSTYAYNRKSFCDIFGSSSVYYFNKPFVKFILGTFFYKGFPVSDKMRQNALRLRENGLVLKKFRDFYFARLIKFHFHEKEFQSRFIIPWFIYVAGCSLATIVFIFELVVKRSSS